MSLSKTIWLILAFLLVSFVLIVLFSLTTFPSS